jgi:dihydrofolate synthase/folylpolyglutamate synthase
VIDPFTWLFDLEQFGIKLGLQNVSTILEALGHPERAFRTIHVGGTNGKGSVTAMVDEALRAAGRRTARYTSPHLVDLSERFVIGGQPVARDALAAAIADVREIVDTLRGQGALEVLPTFFETTTVVAFELFRRARVETAVCEVGLGGRLDATNVLSPIASAITSIGADHQQHLGDTLAAIAAEKAGILKPGVPVVVGRMADEARDVIAARAASVGAPLVDAWEGVDVVRLDIFRVKADATVTQVPTRVRLRTPARDYGELSLGLAGDHQIDNAVVATRVLELVGRDLAVAPAAMLRGLRDVSWPGRLDLRRLPDGREVLFDAAHNVDGATALAAFLTSKSKARRPLVFGAMRDKDAAGMLRVLLPAVSHLFVTQASTPRSADPAELAAIARQTMPHVPVAVHTELAEALAAAWRESSRITVAGSIFLLGDALKELALA